MNRHTFLLPAILAAAWIGILMAADPQQPKVGGKELIVATNGYAGVLTVRTQINLGLSGVQATISTDTNGTVQATSVGGYALGGIPTILQGPGAFDWFGGVDPAVTFFTYYNVTNGDPSSIDFLQLLDNGDGSTGSYEHRLSLFTSTILVDHTSANGLSEFSANVSQGSGGINLSIDGNPRWSVDSDGKTLATPTPGNFGYFSVNASDTNSAGRYAAINAGPEGPHLYLFDENFVGLEVSPMAADQAPLFILRAHNAHTTGQYLMMYNSNDVNIVEIETEQTGSPGDYTSLTMANSPGNYTKHRSDGVQTIINTSTAILTLLPTISGAGNTPYRFDTSITHTSGNAGEFANNGTNVVQITATTATPTNTPFILNINGTQKPVFLGPADSGGTGLRALTVAN